MPDIFAEVARDWRAAEDTMRHLARPHHHGAPHPAAQPPPPQVPHTENQEEPAMQWITDAEAHVKAALDKFQQVDHEALNTLEAVQSNPATAEIFAIAGQLTHLPPESLATGLNVLRMTLQALGGQPQPAQQPA
jgi:hypothetical protein